VTVDGAGPDPDAALRTKVAGGVRWGIIISIATQVTRIVFLIALMRLLGPQSYGIVGQATLIVAVAQMFVHFGLAVSIIQRQVLDQSEIGTAFWLNVALGLLLAVLMVVGAPLLAGFFRTEELTAVFRVLSIALILKALAIVPTALLTRHMHFRSLGLVEIVSTFASGVLGVGAAALGADYWALVIQTLAYEAIYMLLILFVSGLPDLSWSTSAARRLWSMSSRVMGADLVNYVSDQSDKFFIARFLGPTSLGLYSLAFRVLQLTLAVLTQVGRVVLPMFARLQDDRERLGRAFLNVLEIVALILCPAMTLTILLAPVAVPLIFGGAWADAVVPLQLTAAMTIQYVLGAYMGPLKIAVGRADWEFRWSIVTMVVALVVFPIGLQWGIDGVAASYLIMLTVLNPIRFMVIQRLVPISVRSCLRALTPAAACSIVLAVVWLLTQALLKGVTSELVIAMAASVIGAAAYVITLRVAWPDDFRRQLEFARLVLRGDRT
jgi:O-antigen/teichoic acid export membrane protein